MKAVQQGLIHHTIHISAVRVSRGGRSGGYASLIFIRDQITLDIAQKSLSLRSQCEWEKCLSCLRGLTRVLGLKERAVGWPGLYMEGVEALLSTEQPKSKLTSRTDLPRCLPGPTLIS